VTAADADDDDVPAAAHHGNMKSIQSCRFASSLICDLLKPMLDAGLVLWQVRVMMPNAATQSTLSLS